MSASTSTLGNPQTNSQEQVVIILVGLIGSGKSTFAQALEQYFPGQFRRCNQDELGQRAEVEALARRTLREGLSPCIDRTNFNAVQRSHWIHIAQEFPETPVWVIVFDTPKDVCAARLRKRTLHPTIKSPEQAMSILQRFANDFQYPSQHEGYDRIISLKPSDHPMPTYTLADVISVLQRLRDSPPVKTSSGVPPTPTNSFWRRGAPPPSAASFRSGSRTRGGINNRLADIPGGRPPSSLPYLPNRSRGRGSFTSSPRRGAPLAEIGTTTRSNNHQRGARRPESFRGNSSDSPNWRGSGTAL